MPTINSGSNFHRYLLKWNNDNFISYGSWLAAPRDKSIFESKKENLVRQTSDTLIATIILEGFIMRNNTHILLSDNDGYSLKYILALLNLVYLILFIGRLIRARGSIG
ncbi:MAG: hypothetical protein IPL26_13715 [Leptospiraceae bacterium]|nr:hypothetical protein [Leptospiraceae bacterium]